MDCDKDVTVSYILYHIFLSVYITLLNTIHTYYIQYVLLAEAKGSTQF